MARYTGPAYKKSRRLGFSTLENGKELAKRPYAPGQHGVDRKKKSSEYGIQLQEKQKMRFLYGLTEKQFKRTFIKAEKMSGIAGENFFKLLESRLDNVVYRMGLATTRRGARQLVNHGHITVNGKKVDIPSYRVKVGDVISLKENSKKSEKFKQIIEATAGRTTPTWLDVDKEKQTAKVTRLPVKEDLDYEIEEHLIVELYSK